MGGPVEFKTVTIEKPVDINFILGQSHFIKTVEDIYEVVSGSVPGAKFGLAFCESSGDCLVRIEGNDEELKALARDNALAIGAGHSFILFLRDCFPINVLNAIKNIQEVCTIYCATANPAEVVIAESAQGRGILGVIDGERPKGVEGPGRHCLADGTAPEVRVQEGVGINRLHDAPAMVIPVKECSPVRYPGIWRRVRKTAVKRTNGTDGERDRQHTLPFTRSCRLPVDLPACRERVHP
jgi:adenosine/AMP kinase